MSRLNEAQFADDSLIAFLTSEQRAAISAPISRARTFPSLAYTDPAFFALEIDRIFDRQWMAICFESPVSKPGDVLPIEVLGQPLLVVRGDDGALRVFHNICAYDSCQVVSEAGSLSKLVVPYHGWEYDLTGRLVATPYWDGGNGPVRREKGGRSGDLVEIRSACALGVIFIDHQGQAPELNESLRPVFELLEEYDLERLHARPDSESLLVNGRIVSTNWKTYLENAAMNVLHESFTHASYESSTEVPRVTQRGTKTYFDHIDGPLMGLGYRVADFKNTYARLPLPHLGRSVSRSPESGYFLTYYPNLVIPVMPSMIRVNICLPISPTSSQILHCGFFHANASSSPQFEQIAGLIRDGFHEAYREDGVVIEAIQRGRASPVSGMNFYSPFWDEQHHHFNQLILSDLERPKGENLP